MLHSKTEMTEKPDGASTAKGRTPASRKFAREVYKYLKQNPAALDRYSEEMQHYFECKEEMLHNARMRIKHLSDLESFDQLYLQNYSKAKILMGLMNILPAADVKKGFGKDALIWSWINSDGRQEKSRLDEMEKAGIDASMMQKARVSAAELAGGASYLAIAPLYELLTRLVDIVPRLDIGKLLSGSGKTELSEKRIADYSLGVLISNSGNSSGNDKNWALASTHPIYMDAPVGISLFYKGKPNAACCFAPISDGTLLIYQLQGVRPKHGGGSRGLVVLDWQKLLVDACLEIAKKFGLGKVGIQPAKYNTWLGSEYLDGSLRISLVDLVKRYDAVALRLGFSRGNDGNWRMPLEQAQGMEFVLEDGLYSAKKAA